jgi:transcriptional regulator with XRE-family HTH domain
MTAPTREREHGYARYKLNGCRCEVCRQAVATYNRKRAMRATAGTWQPFVDAEPIRRHLEMLGEQGISLRRVAQVAGIDRKRIQALINGTHGRRPSNKVRPETAAAILSVQPDVGGAPGSIVDGTGTARRIRALAAIGWSLTQQANRIGWAVQNYARMTDTVWPVTVATARLIADLYDELSMTPAPAGYSATRTQRMALDKGWAPPLAWDDDEIDDPKASPHGFIRKPKESLEHFIDRYRQVAGHGLAWAEIAERLGVTVDAAKSRVARARRNGLLEQVNA